LNIGIAPGMMTLLSGALSTLQGELSPGHCGHHSLSKSSTAFYWVVFRQYKL
jgi:hypothetical protein